MRRLRTQLHSFSARAFALAVAMPFIRDWKEPGGLDRNSAFMVRWRLRPTRRKHALEHHTLSSLVTLRPLRGSSSNPGNLS
jgi:hypothetical protein